MTTPKRIIIVMMTIENILGREILSKMIDSKIAVTAVIIEHKSKLAENTRNYLKNKHYNPKSFLNIVKDRSINIHYVEHHNKQETLDLLKRYSPDYIVLGGTRILNEQIINTAKIGILNAHPAILPKYQGLDCVAWSILNNDPVGVTVHYIDPGIDTGPIILQETIDYTDCRSLIEVRIKTMRKCAELMIKSLKGLESGILYPKPQDHSLAKRHNAMDLINIEYIEKLLSSKF